MYRKFGKRFFDIILSILGLILFAIIFIPIAIAIYLEDKGPIFYLSDRIGENGKIFKMYKFRSMKVNSPDIRLKDGSTYNSKDDIRVTKVGRIIRKTSIDEFPQFLNVILGHMSIIGPRPFVPVSKNNNISDDYKIRLSVKPGITGYTQAYYRNSINQNKKIEGDAYYAQNVSLIFDIKILFKTIVTVLQKKNIYLENEENIYG